MNDETSRLQEPPRFEVRPIKVEIVAGAPAAVGAVALEDVSHASLRGRFDFGLPEGCEFHLRIHLRGPVEMTACVAWQRPLPSGGALARLDVVPSTPADAALLASYVATLHAPSRRRVPRVADILPLDVVVPEVEEWYSAIATDLSERGMCLVSDEPLPAGRRLLVIMLLGWGPPVEVEARMCWCRPSPWQGHEMGLEFLDPSPAVLSELREYLATDMGPEPPVP